MRSSYLDYLISSILISLISLCAFAAVYIFSEKISSIYLSDSHILLDLLLFVILFSTFSAMLIRLIVQNGILKPGSYDMKNPQFRVWKIVCVLYEFSMNALSFITIPFIRPPLTRLFGGKVGNNVVMGGKLIEPWFIEIEDNVVLGLNSAVIAHEITSGHIKLKHVKISQGVTIGVNSVIMPGVIIGKGVVIAPGSIVISDTVIPENQLWVGIPAKFKKNL